jgi:hypothetical protein
MKVTFCKLRDRAAPNDWGLRGSDGPPPSPGTKCDVTKKHGDVVSRVVGNVVAQGVGDEGPWWIAEMGYKEDTRPPGQQEDIVLESVIDGGRTEWSAEVVERLAVSELTEEDHAEDAARKADQNETMDRDNAIEDSMTQQPVDDAEDFNWEEV